MKRREWRSAWGGRERESEREKEREREREIERVHAGERVQEKVLWLLLLYVFSSTWACPMQIGLNQECCLFCLKSSLWSLDLPCLLATTILDSCSLFYLPNTSEFRNKTRVSTFTTIIQHSSGSPSYRNQRRKRRRKKKGIQIRKDFLKFKQL